MIIIQFQRLNYEFLFLLFIYIMITICLLNDEFQKPLVS